MGFGTKKKIGRTDEIDIIVDYYKEKAEELMQNGNVVENWFECLKKIYYN